jgi:hypothetical protein
MKTLLSFLFIACFSISTFAQDGLGLAERRAIKEYQEKQFPELEKAIKAGAGFDVPLDVKWEQIALPGQANLYKTDIYWGTTIFKPLAEALSSITKDSEGKAALKSKLKKIVIMFNNETAPMANFPNGLTWNAGVLTINYRPNENTNENYMKERVEAITKLVESKL